MLFLIIIYFVGLHTLRNRFVLPVEKNIYVIQGVPDVNFSGGNKKNALSTFTECPSYHK